MTALILLIASSAVPAEDVAVDGESLTDIHVSADDTEFDMDTQAFRAEGNAVLRYGDMTLTADHVHGNAETGDFEAAGNVVFIQGDRTVKGEKFTYNYKSRVGHSSDASATLDMVYFRGKELDSNPEGYRLTGSTFTTCNLEKPHYYLSARELIIRPGDRLIARGVRFVALGKTLFSVPKYTSSLKPDKRSEIKLPMIGVSGKYGTFLTHSFEFEPRPGINGKLGMRLSSKEDFQGRLTLTRGPESPLSLSLAYREPYYGGRSRDTIVSRLPEAVYRIHGDNTSPVERQSDQSLHLSGTVLRPSPNVKPNRTLRVIGEAGVGRFKEEPSSVEFTRMDLRAMAWMDGIEAGKVTIVPGAVARYSHYSSGDDYSALGLQVAAGRKLGTDSYASLTYVAHAIGGRTPFDFDQIEIPQELAGRLRFPTGSFAIELTGRYDLDAGSMFDSSISISKPFHCIEPKITWRSRFSEISFGLGLVDF